MLSRPDEQAIHDIRRTINGVWARLYPTPDWPNTSPTARALQSRSNAMAIVAKDALEYIALLNELAISAPAVAKEIAHHAD